MNGNYFFPILIVLTLLKLRIAVVINNTICMINRTFSQHVHHTYIFYNCTLPKHNACGVSVSNNRSLNF